MTYVHRNQSQINQRRLELIKEGYVTRRDICEFVPCSYNKSRKIFDTITQEIEKEGYERIDDNILLARRLLDFLGLSEESIKKLAVKEQEMQENGQSDTSIGRYGLV